MVLYEIIGSIDNFNKELITELETKNKLILAWNKIDWKILREYTPEEEQVEEEPNTKNPKETEKK